jgi:hypothetical protein
MGDARPTLAPGSTTWLNEVFKYHAPSDEQVARYQAIRGAAKALAETIALQCPPSADRTTALRHVREAVFNANAAIALRGLA